ncbi:MAG TPA: OsmC family protein [Candidatus Solibacter sp.]|nr:OsmC family protein [Candidatus Solibacter sp.]
MAAEYTYRVSAWWTSGRAGLAKCESSPNTIHFSDAAELGGLQSCWTPEQLLLCALAGSFTTAFHDVARLAKFEYTDLEVEVEGVTRRSRTEIGDFQEVHLNPILTVASEDQREIGLSLLRKAMGQCRISHALATPLTLNFSVETGKVPVEGWSNQDAVVKLGV